MCANAMEVLCCAVGFCEDEDEEVLGCDAGGLALESWRVLGGGVLSGMSKVSSLGVCCR